MARDTTLSQLLDEVAGAHPTTEAVIESSNGDSRRMTYQQLWEVSRRTAGKLSDQGVRRGDVVGIWLPNWTETLVLEFALAWLGAAALGINTRYSVHELSHLLQTGPPVGIVVPGAFHGLDFVGRLHQAAAAASIAQPALAMPWICTVDAGWRETPAGETTQGLDIGGGWWSLDRAHTAGALEMQSGVGTDPVNYFTTSGSTGVPKLAGHDQAAVVTHARNVAHAADMQHGDVLLCALPLSGVFGFNPAMAMLAVGGTCLLEPVFEAARVVQDMHDFSVTHVFGGDDLLGRIMDAWHEGPLELPRFRRGGIADFAGRATDVVAWADEALGACISGVYGSSELFSLTSVWPTERSVAERAVGGGRVVAPDIEVRVADADGTLVAAGETGELQFRGYNILTTYLGGTTTAALTSDGWFRSGDLGRLTGAPGEFVYICRAGDALRLQGFLVEPAEIERFLMGHPSVTLAKVVGVTDAKGQDRAVAYVSLTQGSTIDVDGLVEYCRRQLAPFKVPSLLRVISDFPVTAGTNGTKIRTAELRQWAKRDLIANADLGGRL